MNVLKSENLLLEFLSKLFIVFSENPLFNIFYRWLLVCFTPAILGYSICHFISNQDNLAKSISLIILSVATSFYIYSVIHLPKRKNRRYLYIMLYSNSNDTTLVTNGIAPKCKNLCKNKSYSVSCPNKSCRYFYNWIKSKCETSNSKFFDFFNTYVENHNSVFVFGVLNDERSHNKKVSKIIPNIHTNTDSSSIVSVTSLIEHTSFTISNNDTCNDLDSFSQMMVAYADYIFSTIDNKPQVKKLNAILDIYENAQNISSAFPENRFKTIIENMTNEITSKPVDESQIDEYILFCKRFLSIFPNNIKILLDLQYFSISRIRNKSIAPSAIKQIAEDLLRISNVSSSNNSDGNILALNKAYLFLLNENFDYAIKIYHSISILPPEIFNFFIETMDSPTLGIYSKYAFVINYYHNNSSPHHKKAIAIAQSLKQEYELNPNAELYKSLKKFTKQRAFIKKK